ncbi:Hint domain-containing protein [Pseudooceanicola sp. C21-150M6]|uniref:Hint domain-containing protein n=1 Tax=Pseudooceanicola sp. C21-150M6 TaxID=3434355 RepID=UPI003D7F6138
MGSANIDVEPYLGALAALDLLSGTQTLVLGSFGAEVNAELIDSDGILSTSDDGISTFNGNPVTYIGSGTATPGVDVAGITVPIGTTVDLVVFEAGGQIFFHYPAGDLDLTAAIAVVIDIDSTAYPIFAPACFTPGTLIRIPGGECLVESLRPGDYIEDVDGKAHEVIWTYSRTIQLDTLDDSSRHRLAPIRIFADALGPGRPRRDIHLSQQHLVRVKSAKAEVLYGMDEVLVPARALNHAFGRVERDLESVTYIHVLCAGHVIVRAEGLATETLFLGPEAIRAMSPYQLAALRQVSPARLRRAQEMTRAAPTLTLREGQLLVLEMIANPRPAQDRRRMAGPARADRRRAPRPLPADRAPARRKNNLRRETRRA